MKSLRTILFIYCLLAAAVCFIAIILMLVRANHLSNDAIKADALLTEAVKREQTLNAELKELEKIQRRDRHSYTGPEAVAASIAVQDAKAVHEDASAARQEAEQQLNSIIAMLDRTRLLLIPLFALMLLHGAGAFFFSPIRRS